jgi:hypothetical protein
MPDDLILKSAMKNFLDSLASEVAEDVLQLLLGLMAIVLDFNPGFRKNIDGFNGRYQFKSKDGHITVAAVFKDNRLEVREEEIPNPHITVLFKDGKALMGYLLSPKPDILGSILHQEVSLDGNLNYLYKFAFMSKRLQLMAQGTI